MKFSNSTERNNIKTEKILLKNISKFISMCFKAMISIIILGFLIFLLFIFSKNDSNFPFFYIIVAMINLPIILFLIPSFIAATYALRYYKGRSNGKLTACWTWGIICFITNLSIVYILPKYLDSLGEFNQEIYIIYYVFSFGITYLPNILYLIGCHNERVKLSK